jgi:hypothetical protein
MIALQDGGSQLDPNAYTQVPGIEACYGRITSTGMLELFLIAPNTLSDESYTLAFRAQYALGGILSRFVQTSIRADTRTFHTEDYELVFSRKMDDDKNNLKS